MTTVAWRDLGPFNISSKRSFSTFSRRAQSDDRCRYLDPTMQSVYTVVFLYTLQCIGLYIWVDKQRQRPYRLWPALK
jgi:hypothetical protein